MTWLPILLFVILFASASAGEVWWLVRNEWATARRAALYVAMTSLLGLGVGTLIVFVVGMIILMMVFGASGTGGTAPEWAYWIVLGSGAAAAISFLFFVKRAFLGMFAIRRGKAAWIYSLITSILISICVSAPIAGLIVYSMIGN